MAEPDDKSETQIPAEVPDTAGGPVLIETGTTEPPPAAPVVEEPPVIAPPARPRRGGFVPAFLGGILAAALGFAAAWYVQGPAAPDLSADLAAQEQATAALSARLDALPAAPDLSPLSQEIAAIRADLVSQTDGLRPALEALTARVDALERAPAPDGSLSQTALAAWQSDIDGLRADLSAQSARIDALAAEAQARLDATADDIAQIGADAAAAAETAARRGALSRVLAALDTGAPFADALAEAGVQDSPQLAALAETGAPTLPALREGFPEAARAAMAVARDEGLAGESGGLTGFLRSQFEIRSTTPQEGDTPDAILSRAEAALDEGALDAAMAEIASLPEVVRAAMGDWLAQAQTRQAALAEANALAATLTDN